MAKNPFMILPVLAAGFLPGAVLGGPFVTNFTALDGSGSATGVWRDQGLLSDLAIPVTMSQSGGTILGVGAPDPTVLDDSFPWMDAPPMAPDLFEPNFTGDLINVEVAGGGTAAITVDFHGVVEDPVISVRGIGPQTVLYVSEPITVVAMAPNMVASTYFVTSDGTPIQFLGEETSGSLRVEGTFTGLTMTLANFGTDPVADRDQVGFVFATDTAPSRAAPLEIMLAGANLVLSWPDTSTFGSIESSPDLGADSWTPLEGVDPTKSTSYMVPAGTLGEMRYFRGIYAE